MRGRPLHRLPAKPRGLRSETLFQLQSTGRIWRCVGKAETQALPPGHGFGGSAEAAKRGGAWRLDSRFVPPQRLRNNAGAGTP